MLHIRRLFSYSRRALALVLVIMIVPSFYSYTSVGFDLEYSKDGYVVEDFYRLRWPGDGSIRLGLGRMLFDPAEEDVDIVDIAGKFFEEAQVYPDARSWIRTWLPIRRATEDGPGERYSVWICCPSWLPPLVMLGFTLWRRRRNRTNTEN